MKACTFRSQPSKFFPNKIFYIFFQKKPAFKKFLYFLRSKMFLYFRRWNPALFSLSLTNKKIHPDKFSDTSGNRNCEKNSCFSQPKSVLMLWETETPKILLYFRKQNFSQLFKIISKTLSNL